MIPAEPPADLSATEEAATLNIPTMPLAEPEESPETHTGPAPVEPDDIELIPESPAVEDTYEADNSEDTWRLQAPEVSPSMPNPALDFPEMIDEEEDRYYEL